MLPSPSQKAVMALCGCAATLLIGWAASSPSVVTLGGGIALGLCIAFALTAPAASRLRRARVELSWWVEPSRALPVAGATFDARCSLRNRGDQTLLFDDLRVIAPEGVEVSTGIDGPLSIPAGKSAELDLKIRAPAAGRVVLHGVVASVPGPFGLFSTAVRFPSPLSAKVLPRAAARSQARVSRNASETVDRAARSSIFLRGAGTALHEIREYQPGDPFNAIAWKPSARAGRLMVREVERETQRSVAMIVDASATMRGGVLGKRKLDLAIEIAARAAQDALRRGDQFALRAVDGRVVASVPAGEGAAHLSLVYEALLKITEVVDEDLTEIEDATLMRRVASYLRQQDGIDLFVHGQLDTGALTAHVARMLDGERQRVLPIASSRALGRLRRFCQLRGIALPYRTAPTDKLEGLAQALRAEAGDTRATRSLIVVTDLDGASLDDRSVLEPFLRVVKMLRGRGHSISFIVPELGQQEALGAQGLEQDLWRAAARTEARRVEEARRALGRLGVSLAPVSR